MIFFFVFQDSCLEGQVVGTSFTGRFLCGRERSGSILRSSALRWEGTFGSGSSGRSYDTALNVEGADVVKPATVELMSIYVERYGHVFTHLNIELFDAVFTEHTEYTLLGVLSRNFNHIILRHP